MRFENATITLAPRTLDNCLDLAVLFVWRQMVPILKLWALFAVPSCVGIYLLAQEFDAFWWMLLVWYMVTGPFGVLLASTTSLSAFGEPFSVRHTLQQMNAGLIKLLLSEFFLRAFWLGIGAIGIGIPLLLSSVYFGFRVEHAALERFNKRHHNRRTKELVGKNVSDLITRRIAICLFTVVLWSVWFVTVDKLSSYVLQYPIFVDRIISGDYSVWTMLNDPTALAIMLATGLLAYPIGRIAWFFCYIDLRVRLDLWDIELQFLQHAKQLSDR